MTDNPDLAARLDKGHIFLALNGAVKAQRMLWAHNAALFFDLAGQAEEAARARRLERLIEEDRY